MNVIFEYGGRTLERVRRNVSNEFVFLETTGMKVVQTDVKCAQISIFYSWFMNCEFEEACS